MRNLPDLDGRRFGWEVRKLLDHGIISVSSYSMPSPTHSCHKTRVRYLCDPDKIEPVEDLKHIIRCDIDALQILEEQNLHNIQRHK